MDRVPVLDEERGVARLEIILELFRRAHADLELQIALLKEKLKN